MNDIGLKQTLRHLHNALSDHESRFSREIEAVYELENDFLTELQRIEADEQCLSIGIMGQVKAGKSSFLNALLFDGQPVLPEAATPKTANLTRITYGEQPQLSVHYYSPEEWEGFTQAAASEADSVSTRVARDLLQMVKTHGIDVAEVLARCTETFPATGVADLMGRLNDYVGENGRYTALAKFTEIQLPLPELHGFEIIDTPGMNDPVESRTQKTREYMARCDVVFFLSRCSQFLDQSDMELLGKHLPVKGIKRLVLVAGQLDGVISDDGFDRASLAETEKNVRTRLARRAEAEMEQQAAQREQGGNGKVAALLRSLKTPILASTYAHGYAHWDESRWGKGMRHMHQELTGMAKDSWGNYTFTREDWERIGNFGALTAAYESARQDKLPLLRARRDDLMPRTRENLANALDELAAAAEHRMARLKTGDIKSIEANTRACEGKMAGIADKLRGIINLEVEKARSTAGTVKAELQNGIGAASNLQTRTGTKKEKTGEYTISTSTWYKPWTWGDKETIEEFSYVTYEYIAAADAVERLVNYANESAASLSRTFNNIINMTRLRAELKRSLIDELTTGNQGFDPAEFRRTLEGTLNALKLPTLKLDIGDCGQLISDKFSGNIRKDKKIAALRETLRESLALVHGKLLGSFEAALKKLCDELEAGRDSLEQKLTASLRDELAQLRSDFTNREAEIKAYEDLVQTCRKELKNWAEAAVRTASVDHIGAD
ncbi:MAG: dynamin family protein [Zoogloea sp.]|nr:dynamin family protein [Zoogloea sp.]